MKLSAIVLCAGRGERMGGPKARLVVPGGPLVALHVVAFASLGASPIVVATTVDSAGPIAALAEISAHATTVTVIGVDTPEPAVTLARAVAAAPLGDVVLITPVDAMPVSRAIAARLIAAVAEGASAATPTFDGRGGHPVACRREVLAPYESGAPPPILREMLAALGDRRVRLPVDAPGVAMSLDTPGELEAAFGVRPVFF